ncbi:DUF551 domain-containing protein [Yersinia enterocolitica]
MKELDSFTVERLEELSTKENIPEVAALARIALAAKRAEPVAYMTYKGYLIHAGDPKLSEYSDPEPLYDAPQLNSPEIPEGWIKCSDQMPESQQWGLVWAKWFNQQVLCWEDVGGQWTDFDGQSYSQDQITHWMPLPAAPEKENG